MRKRLLTSAAFVLALAMHTGSASAQPADGSGFWGPGMMRGYGPGQGMMWGAPDGQQGYGPGYGQGYGPGYGQGYGPGMMMGRGFGPGMMMGNGMMGYGPGMMGWTWSAPENLNLTVDQVKARFERWLAFQGNARIKLGKVVEKDANTITAEIVTSDKEGLVERYIIDRKSGALRLDG